MHKGWIICVIIILFVIVLNFTTQNYTQKTIEEITNDLEDLKEVTELKDKDRSNSKVDAIIKKWDDKYEVLTFYIDHNELEKVKTELVSLQANIDSKDYDQASVDINRTKFLLEHIMQKITLQVKNIF